MSTENETKKPDLVAYQVSQQRDDCAGALLVLLQLRDALNQGVGAVAHESGDASHYLRRLTPYATVVNASPAASPARAAEIHDIYPKSPIWVALPERETR